MALSAISCLPHCPTSTTSKHPALEPYPSHPHGSTFSHPPHLQPPVVQKQLLPALSTRPRCQAPSAPSPRPAGPRAPLHAPLLRAPRPQLQAREGPQGGQQRHAVPPGAVAARQRHVQAQVDKAAQAGQGREGVLAGRVGVSEGLGLMSSCETPVRVVYRAPISAGARGSADGCCCRSCGCWGW